MKDEIRTEDELRAVLPPPPERLTLKIRPSLESTGQQWIDRTALVALATKRADGLVEVAARTRTAGVVSAPDENHIRVDNQPESRIGEIDDNLSAHPWAGLLCVLPGIDSTLRANGRASANQEAFTLDVTETYMHCPKAFVRSKLWGAQADSSAPNAAESGSTLGLRSLDFLCRSPFLFLGTCNSDGEADVSPRGDPAGFVRVEDDGTLLLPDRPGNHIADSFRNIIDHGYAGLLCLIPGVDAALRIAAEARLTTDPTRLAPMEVQGRAPKLGIELRVQRAELGPAEAITRARLWAAAKNPPDVPSLGRTIVNQVEGGRRFQGIKARLLDQALKIDVKKNLY